MGFTINQLDYIMPNAGQTKINLYLNHINTYMTKYKIDTPLRMAAFIGNVAHETDELSIITENYNYSAIQAYKTFPKYFSDSNAAVYFANTKTVLSYVYQKRMGNGDYNSGDGTRYRGRGLLQMTGREDYAKFQGISGAQIVANPDIVATNPQYAAWSACWEFGSKNGIMTAADNNDFRRVCKLVNGADPAIGLDKRIYYYNRALEALNTGIAYNDSTVQSSTQTRTNTAGNLDGSANIFDFSQLERNIENAELDNTDVSWGSRTSAYESSDYIGLKQYLIYLITRFYPKSLVPFIELIPVFSVQNTLPQNNQTFNQKFAEAAGLPSWAIDTSTDNLASLTPGSLFDENRYNKTSQKLIDLMNGSGTDLTLIDPFEEYSSQFNVPNEDGNNFKNLRGLTYKVYGSLVLNPSAQVDVTSKPGAVGLTGVEIEQGSQTQNGLSLITIRLLDVQGNKFLDPNSPWSFILNQRPGMQGGDFYFRFGWQVGIPQYDPNNNYQTDPLAKQFWNHPGWKLFQAGTGEGSSINDGGAALKQFIASIAQQDDWSLTITQSNTLSSLKSSGFKFDSDGNLVKNRDLRAALFDYYTLTLIMPELNVNPKDGSVEAVLQFRTNSAVANCLCPLNFAGFPKDQKRTQALVMRSPDPTKSNAGNAFAFGITLANLMTAFVQDNRNYIYNNPALSSIPQTTDNKNLFFADDIPSIDSWLTVIGGAGTDNTVTIKPESIPITISPDLKNEITNATARDNRLLIEWLNKVLYENNMALISSADYGQNVNNGQSSGNFSQGFVIVYDSDAKTKSNVSLNNDQLSRTDATFGDFLNYTGDSSSDQNFVGNRLFASDDVFAFRFQGSLIEDITVEKNQGTNQAIISAQQNFAEGLGNQESPSDIKEKQRSTTAVTVDDKKINFAKLYASMLGLRVTCLAHPWLKLTRPCYVKGMGFWDGKYMITRIVHRLNSDNRFVSEINACRILDKQTNDSTANQINQQERALNNPSAYLASDFIPTSTKDYNGIVSPQQYMYEVLNGPVTINQYPDGVPLAIQNPLRTQLEQYVKELHPFFQQVFRNFITEFEAIQNTYKVYITSGYRTFAEQATLNNQDSRNAAPGRSMHNYGLAIDLNLMKAPFSGSADIVLTKDSSDAGWLNSGIVALAEKYNLRWGGAFSNYKDRVHFGFDKKFDTSVLLAMARKQFGTSNANVQGNKIDLTGSTILTSSLSKFFNS